MKDYLDEAKRIINHNSSAMIAGNKFYRRNRIIDMEKSYKLAEIIENKLGIK